MFGKVFRIKTTATLGKHISQEGIVNVDTTLGGGLYLNGSALAAAELTYIDGITAIGSAQASKALVLDTGGKISFASIVPVMTDADNALISFGTWNDAVVLGTQTAHFVPIQVHMHSNVSAAFDVAAARFRVDTSAANTANAVGCLQLRQEIGHNVASSAILNASVSIPTDATVTVQTGSLLGGYFSIEGAGTIVKAGSNDCTVLEAVCNMTGEGLDNVFLALQNGTGTTIDEIVKVGCTNGTATVGLLIANDAGTITTGQSFTGAMSVGIDFSGMTCGTNAGDATASLILAGKATTGGHTAPSAPITYATANQHGLQFYLKSTANKFTGMEMNAYTDAAMAGTQWANMCVAGEFTVRSLGGASVDNMWAGLFQAQILSTYYGPGTGKLMTAGLFKTGVASTSGGVAGLSAGIYIDTGIAKASTQGDYGIFLISNNGASIPLSAGIHIAGGMDYVFDFAEVMTEPNGNAWDTTGAVTNTVDTHAKGWIKVKMIASGSFVDRYIQLFDTTL